MEFFKKPLLLVEDDSVDFEFENLEMVEVEEDKGKSKRPRNLDGKSKSVSVGFSWTKGPEMNNMGEENHRGLFDKNRRASCPVNIKNIKGSKKSSSITSDCDSGFSTSLSSQGSSCSSSSAGDEIQSNNGRKMSIFSRVLGGSRRNSQNSQNVLSSSPPTSNDHKHKKLDDNYIDSREPVLEGVTFYVKYLGSTLIDKESTGATEAAEATKTVMQMAKVGKRSPPRIGLTISCRGITLLDSLTGEITNQISIYDIAHCSTDSNSPNVFAFIATNNNSINECFCFASRKRKLAQQATLTIAEAFNLAYEIWSKMESIDDRKLRSDEESSEEGSGSETVIENKNHSQWVHFDEGTSDQVEVVETLNETLSGLNLVKISPYHNNSNRTSSKYANGLRQRRNNSIEDHDEDLLICFDD